MTTFALGSLLYGRPHLITQEALDALHDGYQAHLRTGGSDVAGMLEEGAQLLSKFSFASMGGKSLFKMGGDGPSDGRDESGFLRIGNVGVVSVAGVIGRNIPMMKRLCSGGCDLNRVDRALVGADTAADIEHIVLFADSPGGSAVGTPETAALFRSIGERKDTISFTNGECCSAAFYIASQARWGFCSRSAVMGSVGVRAIFLDKSMQIAADGVKVNAISTGKWKCSGAMWKEMSDEERAMFTAQSQQICSDFRAAVSACRPQIAVESMEGQCFIGAKAVEAGLADGLVDSLDELVTMLLLQPADAAV